MFDFDNNRESVKHLVLKNLIDCNGKPLSMFHAIRNIADTTEALHALKILQADGLIERSEIGSWKHVFYRYKSEHSVLSLYGNTKTLS